MHGKLVLFILTAALLFAACLDDDPTTKTPRASGTATTSDRTSSGDDEATLRQLLADLEEGTFTATYEADGASLGYPDEPGAPQVTFTLHIAKLGSERSRTTISLKADQHVTAATVIHTAETAAVCTDELGNILFFRIGDKMCIDASDAFPGQEQLVSLNPFDSIKKRQFKVIEVDHRTVAGEPATCYRVTDAHPEDDPHFDPDADPAEREALLCWSGDGRMLSMGGATNDSGNYVLQEFSDNVAPDAFDLPYPLSLPPGLEVVNETDKEIHVLVSTGNPLGGGGDKTITPHSRDTLRSLNAPRGVSVFGADSEWAWSCSWEDAKQHEPLVVTGAVAPCTDTSQP